MKWFRQTLRSNRVFILTVLAVNIFYMVEGARFVEARQLRLQEEERHLEEFSLVFDIPMENLRGDEESVFEPIKKLVTDEVATAVEAGYGRLRKIARQGKDQAVSHLSQTKVRVEELIGTTKKSLSSFPQAQIVAAFPQERPSPIQTSETERVSRAPRSLERSASSLGDPGGMPLPLRRVEKKVRTEEAVAPVGGGRRERERERERERMEWNGMEWNGMEWNGMEWNGMEWNGMEWNGMEWNGIVGEGTARVAPPVPRQVIPKDGIAPEIVALAESLGNSPAKIFSLVHDSIDFDPKWGVHRSPLGTLHEGKGTAWDQAWLLQQLLTAAGVDARFQWGEIEIPTAILLNLTGVEDPWQAGNLMTTAGVPIVLMVQGSQVLSARMSHVWLTAHIDFIPNRGMTPGPGDTWVRMDPTFKRFAIAEGVRLDDQVPFDLGEYLQSGTPFAPRQVYEEALQAYIADNNLGISLEEVKPSKTVIQDAFPFVPGTLRGRILTFEGESPEVPSAFQQQLDLEIRDATGSVLATWSTPWSAVYGQRLEVAWPGATDADQAALDLYGGVFATPPYEVDLKPVIRVDGLEVAAGGAIGSAEDVVLLATITPPQGSPTVMQFELLAGEHGVFTVDFGQMPQEVIDRYTLELSAATDPIEQEAWTLALAGALYQQMLSGDLEHLAGLRWQRLVQLGTAVLAVQRGAISTAPDGTPLTFSKGPMSLDLGAMPLGLFPATGAGGSTVSTLELLGSQGSFLEGEALSQVIGGEQITAVTFLTRAVREGQTLTLVDAGNVDAALAGVELSAEAEDHVRAGVEQGKVAWIAESQLPVATWQTSGYILEDPETSAAGYFVTFERLVAGLDANIVFHSPQDLDVVTAPIDVVATIEGEAIDNWTLSYQFVGEGQPVVLATGTGSVFNATLAQFDPMLLLNGLYDIVLTAKDIAGQSASKKISISVEGNMKIGNFTLSFIDLAIPLSGLDIEIVRTYDSRQREMKGDFGHGWTLDIRQGSYQNNRPPGDGWQIVNPGGPFGLPCSAIIESKSHLTTVRLSDQEIYRFSLKLVDPAVMFGGCQARAVFEWVDGPLPGTTLEILGNNEVIYQNESNRVLDDDSFEVFEPENVKLATRDGRIFHVALETGVKHLEDLNGNAIDITVDGIAHSSGVGIDFIRDSEGRIQEIADTRGNSNFYAYDFAGDLVQHSDRAGSNTRFTYRDHYLEEIHNALGIRPIRNDYDEDGRLIRHTDAFGKTIDLSHDLANRREVVTNRLGYSRVLEYDSRGNVLRETDELDAVTERTFDGDDNLLTEKNRLGRTTTYTYNTNNDLLTLTDALGQTTTYTYNDRGQILTVTDPKGHLTTSTYDANGNLLSTTDALDQTTSFTYDTAGNRLSTTDALNQTTSFTYNSQGHQLTETDPLGNITTFTNDANGNRLTESRNRTLPNGSTETLVTTFTYDALDRVIQITAPDGSTTSTGYDALGKVLSRTDALGRVTTMTYDLMGRLTEMTFPDNTTQSQTYDAEGWVLTQTDRAGRETRFAYDAAGRLLITTHPAGATQSQTYDFAGQLISTTDARGNTATFAYDNVGRRTSLTNGLGQTTGFTYDANGNQISITDARGKIRRFTYDDLDRLVTTTFPDETTTQIGYDALGRRIRETDQAGITTLFGYDALRRLTSVTDALGQDTAYTYDELGNRLTQTDANGRTTRFEYDRLGRQTARVLPDGSRESMTYNADGTLASHTAFNGATRSFEYDAEQRLTRRTYPDGSEVSFTYTDSGQRVSMTDSRGTTSYTYDLRDRLIEKRDPSGYKLGYTYDSQGNRTSLTASVGAEVYSTTYTYDVLNRLATVIDSQGGVTTFGYDLGGNRSRLTHANSATTYYTYDSLNRMTHLSTENSTGDVMSSYAYTLDAMGNRTRIEEHDGNSRHYVYDDLYRLTEDRVTDPADALVYRRDLSYDSVGNRLQQMIEEGSERIVVSSTYDDRDRLLTADPVSSGWDENGNLTSRTEGGATTTFNWDFENRLTSVVLVDGTVVETTYDADGNRVRTAVTAPGGETIAVDYLVDTAGPLSHVVADVVSGAVQTLYTRANDELIGLFRPESNLSRQYHTDGLGSVRLLSDEAGTVTDRYSYTAFGELIEHVGPDMQPYLFAGERLDPVVKLYNLRARWLDTASGRFVSVDPLMGTGQQPMSQHVYSYAFQNPVNLTDPTGLYVGVIAVGVVAIVVAFVIASAIPPISPSIPIENIPAINISHRGRVFIIGWEAWVDHLYNDAAGHCTVGFGSLVHHGNCTFSPNNAAEAPYVNGITVGEGLVLLDHDIQTKAVGPMRNLISVPLNQHEFDAVASLIFNVGQGYFSRTHTRRLINEGRHRRRANPRPLERHWNGFIFAGGVVQNGLVRRRAQEWDIFQWGEYVFRPWNIPPFP